MEPSRFAAAGLLALTLHAACGGLDTRQQGSPAGGSIGGGAPGSDSGSPPPMIDASSTGLAFDASSTGPGFDASPSPPARDSNTLRVDASVSVIPRPGASPDTAEVRVLVYVAEASSGTAVLDAQVTGGPIG